jgi:4-amino-4-deoxy-L-arabinose transferase-like glycosyltransferase
MFQFRWSTNIKAISADCALIMIIAAFIYLPFLGLSGWSGNEPMRVVAAQEMLRTGNWMVPIIHGTPYFLKPPLMNWMIALSGSFFGTINEWTSRLPSVLAMFMTGISVYFLTEKWLRREGRLFAAVATLSMTGLMKKGVSAEIDSIFIFFVTVTLLIWINGYIRQWKPVLLWSIPLFILGFSFFTKGPQALSFFYLTVFAYLLLRKRVSFLFSAAHLIGMLCFVLIPAFYLSSILQWVPFDKYGKMWIEQITSRAEARHSYSFLKHLIDYPVDVLMSFMPWVLFFMPATILKDLRSRLKGVLKNEIIIFSIVMVAANFPLYWLLPTSHVRYFLPAGPFVAIILGGLFEFYLNEAKDNARINVLLQKFIKILLWLALISALSISFLIVLMNLRFAPALTVLIIVFVLSAVFFILRINSIKPKIIPVGLAFFVGFCWLIYTNLTVQHETKTDNYPKRIAYEINLLLPEDIDTVYELGFNRILNVTSYIEKHVKQLDNFSQLRTIDSKKNKIYFIFDTKFPDRLSDNERKVFFQEMQWEKIYAKKLQSGDGEVVVGYIKQGK